MKKYFLILALIFAAPAFSADTNGIDTKSIEAEGFGEISKILERMTPEQREQVKKQAAQMQEELEKMTPAEREALLEQARNTLKTIDTSKVDVKKIDASKGKNLKGIQEDLDM
ncbi:MAG: hypothetical protein K0R98_1996, partial [Rickettsiaceae bacterium]|nr:hypothetical protein [Rickettsiaceae bacterium]